MTQKIYLASRSPRRRELLQQIGVRFETLLLRERPPRGADVNEAPLAGEDRPSYVTRLARQKAKSGWTRVEQRGLPARPVLAADTVVVLDGEIFGKPDHAEHAAAMLRRLSGREHQVLTAVAVAFGRRVEMAMSATLVEFGVIEEPAIAEYVFTGEPLDKAGGYAIQGRGGVFVKRLSGSYSGVVGLPLLETAVLLRRFEGEPS